ncbi:Transposase IS116/IS110/IS902 family protein [compost metagenome]
MRAFAKSRLQRAKNDRLDAMLIAVFTASLDQMADLPQARFDALLAELTYLEQIEQQIALIKTFAETARTPAIKRRHAQDVARLKARRQTHLLRIEKAVRRDLELARRLDLMISIKGIGLRSALGLVIRLPELGAASRAEIAALAGVAPYDDDSGARRGRRHIQGGRERLRKSLFMCAFTATRHNPDLAAFYAHLRQKGKEHLCAVIAVARKLIILVNAIITRDMPWTPKYTTN